MAELKKNGLWDDVETGSEKVADRMLGPSADYTSMIQVPSQKGVGSEGSVGQIITNSLAVGDYVKQLITGPLQGNAQFVETGGMCKAPNGTVIPRWSYINNRSSGTDAMPPKIKQAIGGGVLDGIIPGMFGDIADMNPLTVMNGLYLDGVPDCQAIECPVTNADGSGERADVRFMTFGLEENLSSCTAVDDATSKTLEDAEAEKLKEKEEFTGMFAYAGPARMIPKEDNTEMILFGVASVVLVLVVIHAFGGKK
jgi:hypothetical protein